jgi:hypothetical protein
MLGDEGAAINELIALGAAFLMVFVVRPLMALGWNYLQAPMRELTDDVRTIRDRLESVPLLPAAPSVIGIRLEVLEFARKGETLLTYGSVPTNYAEEWATQASEFLRANENGRTPLTGPPLVRAGGRLHGEA